MRNVAFSVLLFALAALQLTVVFTELPRSHPAATAAHYGTPGARVELAKSETAHKTSAF